MTKAFNLYLVLLVLGFICTPIVSADDGDILPRDSECQRSSGEC